MKILQKSLPILFSFLLGLQFISCSTLQTEKDKATKKKEEVELKKKNFDTLYKDASENTLTLGETKADIRTHYGQPDDIYGSGSSDSGFEMWTYERIQTDKIDDWQPIRLYFDSGKLVSWTY